MRAIIIASGESLKHICELKNDVANCPAYIVNANISHALRSYPDVFNCLQLKHIANRMEPSILDKELYLKYKIKDLYFTVPEERKLEISRSIAKVKSYGIKDLNIRFVPKELLKLYQSMNNITFYGVMLAAHVDKADEIYMVGLDFWEGEYLNKLSSPKQKNLPFEKNLYRLFKDLISYHLNIKFRLFTVSEKVIPQPNLEIINVKKEKA